MQVIKLALGIVGTWAVFALVFTFLALVLSGCSAAGELPVCEYSCTMQKSWGL